MARLDWLDSTVGIDRNTTAGFAPLSLARSARPLAPAASADSHPSILPIITPPPSLLPILTPPPSLLPILPPPPSLLPILPRSLAIGWNVFGTLKRLSAQASAAGGGMTARLGGDGAVPRTLTVGRSPAGGAVEIVHAIGVRDRGSRRWH